MRASEHYPAGQGAEAVAFDMLQDAGYCYRELTTLEATNDYIVRIRGVINGRHNGGRALYEARYATGQRVEHEIPLIWTIGFRTSTILIWCSRRPVEDLFAQIGSELELEQSPVARQKALTVGPMAINGLYINTSFCWSGEIVNQYSVSMSGSETGRLEEIARQMRQIAADLTPEP